MKCRFALPFPVATGLFCGALFCAPNFAHADGQLVWSDEFNGTPINQNHWTFDIGNESGGYSETATIGSCLSPAGTTIVVVNLPVSIFVQPSSGGLVFNRVYGALQSATNSMEPWNNVNGATSPFTNTPVEPQ